MTLGIVLAVSKTSETSAVDPMATNNSELRTKPRTLETIVPAAMMAEALAPADRLREASCGSSWGCCSACWVRVIVLVYGVSETGQPTASECLAAEGYRGPIPGWIPWVGYHR